MTRQSQLLERRDRMNISMDDSPISFDEIEAIVNQRAMSLLEGDEEEEMVQAKPDLTLYCFEEISSHSEDAGVQAPATPLLVEQAVDDLLGQEPPDLKIQLEPRGQEELEHHPEDSTADEEEAEVGGGEHTHFLEFCVSGTNTRVGGLVEGFFDEWKALFLKHTEELTKLEGEWRVTRLDLEKVFTERQGQLLLKLKNPVVHRLIAVSLTLALA